MQRPRSCSAGWPRRPCDYITAYIDACEAGRYGVVFTLGRWTWWLTRVVLLISSDCHLGVACSCVVPRALRVAKSYIFALCVGGMVVSRLGAVGASGFRASSPRIGLLRGHVQGHTCGVRFSQRVSWSARRGRSRRPRGLPAGGRDHRCTPRPVEKLWCVRHSRKYTPTTSPGAGHQALCHCLRSG